MQARCCAARRSLCRQTAPAGVLAFVALLASPGFAASGPLSTAVCIASKAKAWASLRKCEAAQNAKIILGLPGDPSPCRVRFEAKLGKLTAQAALVAVPCRFRDSGDGTVTDFDSGLQWEQKTDDAGLHDKDDYYEWSSGSLYPTHEFPDGSAFTVFIPCLNGNTSADGVSTTAGFAGHHDWRLPTIAELAGMADLTQPGCMTSAGSCLDQAKFGPAPTDPDYLSSTTLLPDDTFPISVWGIDFRFASLFLQPRHNSAHARGVRAAL